MRSPLWRRGAGKGRARLIVAVVDRRAIGEAAWLAMGARPLWIPPADGLVVKNVMRGRVAAAQPAHQARQAQCPNIREALGVRDWEVAVGLAHLRRALGSAQPQQQRLSACVRMAGKYAAEQLAKVP
jgi:hypothetical protein